MNESAISGVDIEGSKAVLEDLLQKVVQDVSAEDIETLESIRKIYKKTIPFSKRMYVASYLLAQYMTGGKGGVRRNESKADTPRTLTPMVEHSSPRPHSDPHREVKAAANRSVQPSPQSAEAQHKAKTAIPAAGEGKITVKIEAPIVKGAKSPLSGIPPKLAKVTIPEDEAVNIFISIGRGRRVFPRDLVGLLVNAAGVKRERVGDIRVLQSYSFVQMYKVDAEQAIEKLNGYDYRGKQLSVSYSKDKVDGTGNAAHANRHCERSEAISSLTEIASGATQGGTIAMTEGQPPVSASAPASSVPANAPSPTAPSTEAEQ